MLAHNVYAGSAHATACRGSRPFGWLFGGLIDACPQRVPIQCACHCPPQVPPLRLVVWAGAIDRGRAGDAGVCAVPPLLGLALRQGAAATGGRGGGQWGCHLWVRWCFPRTSCAAAAALLRGSCQCFGACCYSEGGHFRVSWVLLLAPGEGPALPSRARVLRGFGGLDKHPLRVRCARHAPRASSDEGHEGRVWKDCWEGSGRGEGIGAAGRRGAAWG
jgi:hypothetical protein